MKKIYLDNNATTQTDPKVVGAMLPYFTHIYGNPSNHKHIFGLEAKNAVENARQTIADFIHAEKNEIVFTSGATESINFGIRSFISIDPKSKPHIIVSEIEHMAILDNCHFLEKEGCDITYIKPEKNGIINPNAIGSAIKTNTAMVCLMHANNEIGTIQPIHEVGEICKNNNILFLVDAVQSAGKIPIDVKKNHIDLLALSAHKLYGPKGVGCLFINSDKIGNMRHPLILGGGQEKGLRSGTMNVPGIIGFSKAVEILSYQHQEEIERINSLTSYLLQGLTQNIAQIHINGDLENRIPGNLNIGFAGIESEELLRNLKHIAMSNGSACSTDSKIPSHVLNAIDTPKEFLLSSIRLGIGRFNTKEELEIVIEEITKTVKELSKNK